MRGSGHWDRCAMPLAGCAVLAAALPALAQCDLGWEALSAGVSGRVTALTLWDLDGPGPLAPVLVAGGEFTAAGGVPAARVAMWDGSAWHALGDGLNGPVWALVADESGGLWAGGQFPASGPRSATAVARWNGQSWEMVGNSPVGTVYALACTSEGRVVATGGFWQLFTTGWVGTIAIWDGQVWAGLGRGLDRPGESSTAVGAALAALPDGSTVVGGRFSLAGSVNCGNFARWRTGGWEAMPPLSESTYPNQNPPMVTSLAADGVGRVAASGSFTSAGGVPAYGAAYFEGGTPHAFGGVHWLRPALAGLSGGGFVFAGAFSEYGHVAAPGVVAWNGGSWRALGPAPASGAAAPDIGVVAVLPGGDVVVGGLFSTIGGVAASNIAVYRAGQQGPPRIIASPPQGVGAVCDGGTAELEVQLEEGSSANVSWEMRLGYGSWAPVSDGPLPDAGGIIVSGAATTRLTVSEIRPFGSARAFRPLATNACGTTVGLTGWVYVLPPFDRACGGIGCDPDYTRDGNLDQEDVARLIDHFGGDNPWGTDPDFNRDGNADQDDIASLIHVIAGGECP